MATVAAPVHLRERRRALGLTRVQLALLAHCSPSSLATFEDGYVPRRSVVLERVEQVLAERESEAVAVP